MTIGLGLTIPTPDSPSLPLSPPSTPPTLHADPIPDSHPNLDSHSPLHSYPNLDPIPLSNTHTLSSLPAHSHTSPHTRSHDQGHAHSGPRSLGVSRRLLPAPTSSLPGTVYTRDASNPLRAPPPPSLLLDEALAHVSSVFRHRRQHSIHEPLWSSTDSTDMANDDADETPLILPRALRSERDPYTRNRRHTPTLPKLPWIRSLGGGGGMEPLGTQHLPLSTPDLGTPHLSSNSTSPNLSSNATYPSSTASSSDIPSDPLLASSIAVSVLFGLFVLGLSGWAGWACHRRRRARRLRRGDVERFGSTKAEDGEGDGEREGEGLDTPVIKDRSFRSSSIVEKGLIPRSPSSLLASPTPTLSPELDLPVRDSRRKVSFVEYPYTYAYSPDEPGSPWSSRPQEFHVVTQSEVHAETQPRSSSLPQQGLNAQAFTRSPYPGYGFPQADGAYAYRATCTSWAAETEDTEDTGDLGNVEHEPHLDSVGDHGVDCGREDHHSGRDVEVQSVHSLQSGRSIRRASTPQSVGEERQSVVSAHSAFSEHSEVSLRSADEVDAADWIRDIVPAPSILSPDIADDTVLDDFGNQSTFVEQPLTGQVDGHQEEEEEEEKGEDEDEVQMHRRPGWDTRRRDSFDILRASLSIDSLDEPLWAFPAPLETIEEEDGDGDGSSSAFAVTDDDAENRERGRDRYLRRDSTSTIASSGSSRSSRSSGSHRSTSTRSSIIETPRVDRTAHRPGVYRSTSPPSPTSSTSSVSAYSTSTGVTRVTDVSGRHSLPCLSNEAEDIELGLRSVRGGARKSWAGQASVMPMLDKFGDGVKTRPKTVIGIFTSTLTSPSPPSISSPRSSPVRETDDVHPKSPHSPVSTHRRNFSLPSSRASRPSVRRTTLPASSKLASSSVSSAPPVPQLPTSLERYPSRHRSGGSGTSPSSWVITAGHVDDEPSEIPYYYLGGDEFEGSLDRFPSPPPTPVPHIHITTH